MEFLTPLHDVPLAGDGLDCGLELTAVRSPNGISDAKLSKNRASVFWTPRYVMKPIKLVRLIMMIFVS
jgi:hypothetical protein